MTNAMSMLSVLYALAASSLISAAAPSINVLLIVADDLGYNDLSSYGSPTIDTPNIDRLAARGARFTQFYAGAPVCTPSRSAMLTGRLPIRSGIYCDLPPPADELFRVFYPTSEGCLPESEVTIGDALKDTHATAMIGKW
jgi:arylsulfatase A